MNNQVFYTLCPMCGQMICAGVKFCPHCGQKFVKEEPAVMACPSCGKVAPKGEKFCSDCGHAYVAKGAASETVPQSTYTAPKTSPTIAARPQRTPMAGGMSQEAFFDKYAGRYTKGWAKWLPIIGIISAAIYLVLMIVMFVNGNMITGVFMIFDVLCVGGLSIAMMQSKKAVFFIAFAVYNGIASVLAFIDMDFSNLLWLAASIYLAIKVYKAEKAYNMYIQTGAEPRDLI